MDTKQKDLKGNDQTAIQHKDDKNRIMSDKKNTDLKSDDKKGDMKKDGDKKTVSPNHK